MTRAPVHWPGKKQVQKYNPYLLRVCQSRPGSTGINTPCRAQCINAWMLGGQVAQNEMLTKITMEKNAKPGLSLFTRLIVAIFLLSSCTQSESYTDAYNECRTLPGHDSIKFQLCHRLAELMVREQELQKKLETIKNEQENIIFAISKSNKKLP